MPGFLKNNHFGLLWELHSALVNKLATQRQTGTWYVALLHLYSIPRYPASFPASSIIFLYHFLLILFPTVTGEHTEWGQRPGHTAINGSRGCC